MKREAIAQQHPEPIFKHFTTEQGLPSSEVYHSIQDSKGYIWFATNMGVCRYDGSNFKTFTTADGLPDNTVFELFEDYKGRIWFVSFSCNLSYFENDHIYQFKYNKDLEKILKGSSVKTSFFVDSNDNVYLGVRPQGYFIISSTGKFTNYNPKGSNVVIDIIQKDPTHLFPVCYLTMPTQAASVIQIQTKAWKTKISGAKFFPWNGVLKSIKRKDGSVLFANGHVAEVKSTLNYFVDTTIDAISIAEDSEGDIWAGTRDGVRLYKKSISSGITFNYLHGFSVSSILQDKEGGLWFTTLEEGVYYLPSKDFLSYTKQNYLTANKVTCITSDDKNTVYAGLSDGSVFSINNKVLNKIYFSENKFENSNKQYRNTNYCFAIYYDTSLSSLWLCIGSSVGFFYPDINNINNKLLDIKYGKTKLAGGFNHFIRGKNNSIYAASWGAIWKINNNTVLSLINKESKRITSIYEDSKERVLIGSLNGLWILKDDGKYIPFDSTKTLLKNRIMFITETKNHILCLATRGAGVLFVKDDSIIQISSKNGLTSDNVEHILIDKNDVWLSTNKGVNRISFSDWRNFNYSVKSYTQLDGLASDEVCQILKLNNDVWVATNKGLTVFNPDNVKNNTTPPPIFITGIRISNEDKEIQKKHFDLTYDQNNITIKYIGLSYKNHGKIKYRYKINSTDTLWNYTFADEIQFAGLEYGDYTFVVSAQNNNGVWSSTPAIVCFTIQPPYWKTWWFRTFFICCILALAGYIIYARNKKSKAKFEIEKKILELKGNALLAQMNPHFIFNSLNSIQSYILANNTTLATRYLTSFSRLIRLILDNSKESEVLLAKEVSALKHYLDLEKMRFKDLFDYSITFDKDINKDVLLIPPMLIQPYVENAILHGIINKGGKGEITIDFKLQNELILCTVTDNGVGRKTAEKFNNNKGDLHKSSNTGVASEKQERLDTYFKGKVNVTIIDLEDELGNSIGTRVEIFIPFSK